MLARRSKTGRSRKVSMKIEDMMGDWTASIDRETQDGDLTFVDLTMTGPSGSLFLESLMWTSLTERPSTWPQDKLNRIGQRLMANALTTAGFRPKGETA